jgi:hypothetical protein
VTSLALPDFGALADTHCVYIRFTSDSDYSTDKLPSTLGGALVVDNIVVTGDLAYNEDFEAGSVNANLALVNSAPSQPFGTWARVHPHATDNDACTENRTCAWIFTDPTLPAFTPEMAFGPDGVVVRNWLDNVIMSPWVAVPATPYAVETIVSYQEFPGNTLSTSRIIRSRSLRSRRRVDNTDTPALGDSVDCVSSWHLAHAWNSLNRFSWRTENRGFASEEGTTEIQVRFRVSDWQLVAQAGAPSPHDPGPGPYIDRVRVGRRIVNDPVFGNAWHLHAELAQDRFASDLSFMSGFENYTPSTDRFGTADFSMSREGSFTCSPCCTNCWFKRPDSIVVWVSDVRDAGITSIEFHGAIVAGPHAGKAPPPWSIGVNGFFTVPGNTTSFVDAYFIDLDDDYFRGGDVLYYFWTATDADGGFASFPDGMTTIPASLSEAEAATGGLFEVSFLPSIEWDPAYLARIAADSHGKLDPTPAELANSRQTTCILYDQMVNGDRRPGDAHRTSFMYTLDKLGYAGSYDVYDHTGGASINNNQVAGRATVEQATGYALIVLDAGFNHAMHAIPDGSEHEQRFDQSQWYRDWLAQANTSEIGAATLWILGPDLTEGESNEPLLLDEMGVVPVSRANQLHGCRWNSCRLCRRPRSP